MTQAGTLQVIDDGGVDKLLIHDADTNDQAVGDLMKVCCCEGYVRLLECESSANCSDGNCPSSGTYLPCDEDSDGSNDYDHVVYIDEGEWEQRAKIFTPSDCTGNGAWGSVNKTGASVRIGCKCFVTAGVAATIPDTCGTVSVTDLETIDLPPGTVLPEVGYLNIDVDGGVDCATCCIQKWYLAVPCPESGCCTPQPDGSFECNQEQAPYYVPCALIETELGGNADDHIGKIIKINGVSGVCVTLGADTVCRLPYKCVSGSWTTTDRVASAITGSAQADCCVCMGYTQNCCEFACVPPNATTYTVSIPSIDKGNAFDCNCTDPTLFSDKCTGDGKGSSTSQPLIGGLAACSCDGGTPYAPTDACAGAIGGASFAVELPERDLNTDQGQDNEPFLTCECEGGFYSTMRSAFQNSGQDAFSYGYDTCGGNATSGCPMLTGAPQDEVSPTGYYGAGNNTPDSGQGGGDPACNCPNAAQCTGGFSGGSSDPCCGRFNSTGSQFCCYDIDCDGDGLADALSDQGVDTNKSHYSSAALGCGIVQNQGGWGLVIRYYQGAQDNTFSGQMKACYGDDASAFGKVWTLICTQDSPATDPSGNYTVVQIRSTTEGQGDCMYTSISNYSSGISIFHEKFISGSSKITVS